QDAAAGGERRRLVLRRAAARGAMARRRGVFGGGRLCAAGGFDVARRRQSADDRRAGRLYRAHPRRGEAPPAVFRRARRRLRDASDGRGARARRVSLALDARRGLAAPAPVWLAAAGIVALAAAVQLSFGMMADVAWLIHCDERWLDGALPYRDFLELNPPASLWLYWPAVALARRLGSPSEAVVSAFGFAAALSAIGVSALILRGVRGAGAGLALAALAALLLLPGQTFCERDHLAAVFGVPFLALALARARGATPGVALAAAAGLGCGAMAAIKPPYALIAALLALYQLRRSGWRAVLRSPEYYVAAALGLAYVGAVAPLFPAYIANELP